MKNNSFWTLTTVFIVTALIMTTYETIKELLFRGSLTTWQSHTITIIITSVLATLSAYLVRAWALSIHLKEHKNILKEQSLASFELILSAVNHIVNNVLNYLQLVKLDVELYGQVNNETVKLLEESLKEADQQMKFLNRIKHPSDPDSYKDIYPNVL